MNAQNHEKISMDKVQETVLDLLASNLDIARDNIRLDSSLVGDLGMDSFVAVNLMFELEEKTGIEIPDQDVIQFQKVSDIVEYIGKRLQA